jgi:hypothetical protein
VYAGTSHPLSRRAADTSNTEYAVISSRRVKANTGSWLPSVSSRNGPNSAIRAASEVATSRQYCCTRW